MGSTSRDEGGSMEIERQEEVKGTDKIREEDKLEENAEDRGKTDKNGTDNRVVAEAEELENEKEGEEQKEGDDEEEEEVEKEVHVTEEVEDENENEGVEKESASYDVEMSTYEQMALETDLVVANILADIIAGATNATTNVTTETTSGKKDEAADTVPCHANPSHSTSKLHNLTEERDRTGSSANQLNKDKSELQAQVQMIANELRMAAAENNSLKKEKLVSEKMLESLLRERDSALSLIEQLRMEKNSLETTGVNTGKNVEESSRMVNSFKEQLKHTMNVSDIQSSRAAKAENEVKELKKKIVKLESNNIKLQELLKEMTLDYAEKGLEWAGKTLDDIFQPSKKTNSKQEQLRKVQKGAEGDAAEQNVEENVDDVI